MWNSINSLLWKKTIIYVLQLVCFIILIKKYILYFCLFNQYPILIFFFQDFAKDPIAKTIQFPVIESSLTEKRKLIDPLRNSPTSTMYSDILNWCDIKSKISFLFNFYFSSLLISGSSSIGAHEMWTHKEKWRNKLTN